MEEELNKGLTLLKKGQKGLVHAVFSRMGLILLLLVLHVLLLFSAFRWFENFLPHIYGGAVIFTVGMVLYLLNSRMDPSAKITWLIVVMLLPVFGALLFWYTQSDIGHRALKDRLNRLIAQTRDSIPQSAQVMERLAEEEPGAAALARYIGRTGCYPAYDKTAVTYFPLGEDKWAEMLRQLEQAQHFIFMEYFIVDEGLMWGRILEILARKAKEGVDVRVMYDGTCEFSTLPHDYPKRLRELGIQCKMFAPVTPFLSTHYNYRDHRKILVIDGHTAFNGGVNLADEYINHIEKHGHWKDTAVMLKGEAVRSFTLMFLQMWNIDEKEPEFDRFLAYPARTPEGTAGYVIPYALAMTHYASLLDSGVKIYEYTPGFVHAKVFVCDGREAVVGTINLDYRSLYHHFECATYLCGVPCIPQIEEDYQATLQQCRQVTPQTMREEKLSRKLTGYLLKALAPLL